MKGIFKIFGVLMLSALLLAGCNKDSGTNAGGNGGGDFTVTVGSGTTPQYSWDAGNAFSISVVRTSEPTKIVWGIATPGQSNIPSPSGHNVVPAGAVPTAVGTAEATLTAGVEYRVSISLLSGKTGFTEFTP